MNTEIRSVVVEREIAHSPEKLWRALTQPHLIAEWLMRNDDFQPVLGPFRQVESQGTSHGRCVSRGAALPCPSAFQS